MGERAMAGNDVAELLTRHDIWRGRQTRPPESVAAPCPSGWSTLDELLGGGWPGEGLVELYAGRAPNGPWRRPFDRLDTTPLSSQRDWFQASLGHGLTALLMPWLRQRTRAGSVALINPPAVPCAERWQREGVTLDELLVIQPRNLRELGWATEEVLQSGACALVIAWLPPLGFALRRRLKLAAETGRSCLATPYPFGRDMAVGGGTHAPSSPAWVQLSVQRQTEGADRALSVQRLKPFHPRQVRLELDGDPADTTPVRDTAGPPLALVDTR
ncbi:hypothetical protein [Guyparkeria sp. SB14A]|uniref:hypothetical protein n=2 Tax=Guyparkeria TaxID=2035712 RepID=UPI00145F8DA7|nr:hypothetical protein [Guyparkeria sp. SB14A]